MARWSEAAGSGTRLRPSPFGGSPWRQSPGVGLVEVASVREVGRQEVQDLMAKGAQVVDVLPAEEYQEDHLPGAIHLPLRRIETEARTALDPSRPVVVYCWDSA